MSIEKQVDLMMKMIEEQKEIKKDIRELKSLQRDVVALSNRMYVLERSEEKQLNDMDISYWANKIRKLEEKGMEFEKQLKVMNESLTLLSQKEPFKVRVVKHRASTNENRTLIHEVENLQKILAFLENDSVDLNLFVYTLKQVIKDMVNTLNTMVNMSIETESSFHFSKLLQQAVTIYGRNNKTR